MLITEKPTAAKKIAIALDDSRFPKEIKKGKVSHFESKRGNDELVIVYALGHLFELKQTESGWTYPRLEYEWVPKYEVEKKAINIKPIIDLIRKLSKDIEGFIVATDYDIEGSLIGYLTLVYACKTDPVKARRMRFSALTDTELKQAFERAAQMDFPMIQAGEVRHEVDWLYGINLTRALTLSIKNTAGWFKVVSTGRVQGPTLSFVAQREREINLFVPVPFWDIHITGKHDVDEIELEYSKKRLNSRIEAIEIVEALRNKYAIVDSINKQTVTQPPHAPFNLSTLQAEAYRHFGFRPSNTLAIAQSLYLDSLISYPRTSSEKLPATLDIKGILVGLGKAKLYADMTKKVLEGSLIPFQGKKTDPAHPAIHPTGEKATKRLSSNQAKLYDLIVRRFLALFGESLVKDHLRADLICENHRLYTRGLQIVKRGWSEYYEPYFKTEDKPLPNINVGDEVALISVDSEEKYTQPPARFNPSSLLKLLEREELGTKATRAGIVDSVKTRGYAVGDRFELSTLGYAVYDTLNQNIPSILSSEMTRTLENKMERIQEGLSNREQVISDVRENLLMILDDFKKKEERIGEGLVRGLQRYWKDTEELGSCPKCGDGILRIINSPKTGKRFVGCSNYKEGKCDQTFPLPQKGTIFPLDETCEYCNHKMIKVVSGRRAWTTCINWVDCPGRQTDLKALEKRRNEQTRKEKGGQENE
ncbi:MAG: DNA topoisomerase I [Candidatus Thorarchaeota archaeon]|nr:DNA topoisomerase I [Candidatus Thorarchaeota archaeon]